MSKWYITAKCGICGKFCVPDDQRTPYGCPDPEYPEPYDPTYYCAKCFLANKEYWRNRLYHDYKYGDWCKSRAEKEAAAELGLIWVGSEGLGTYSHENMLNSKYVTHRYVTQEEYDIITNNKNTLFDVS